MKSAQLMRLVPIMFLFASFFLAVPGLSQSCLDYEEYMHHTFYSPVPEAEYDKFCRQIIYHSDWVFTVVHVATGDPGIPVADEVIALNVSGNEAPVPITALAPSADGFYYFRISDDGFAFTSTFATDPPPDPHYLKSYDISDPTAWSYLDSAYQSLFDPFTKFDVGSNAAYVVDQHPRLFVFDVTDPGNIVQGNYYTLPQAPKKVLLSEDESHLFILGENRMYIYSLAFWWDPDLIASLYLSASAKDFLQVGSHLLVAGVSSVTRVDISDPETPTFDGIIYLDEVEDTSAIAVAGSYLYAAGPNGPVEIQDISDIYDPHYVDSVPITSSQMNPPALEAQGTEFYATFGDRGYFGYDVAGFERAQPAASISLLRHMVAMDRGGTDWFVTVGYGRFRVVEVQNPLDPLEVGTLPFNYTLPTDIWTNSSNAYVTTRNGEFVSYSVADHQNPELIGSCTVGPGYALDVLGTYAFVAAGTEGLKVIRIVNPANPNIVASVASYYEETTGLAIKGAGAYVAFVVQSNTSTPRLCGLAVVDISTPWSPMVFDIIPVPLSSRATRVENYVLLHGEGMLTVVDISNAFYPEIHSVIGLPGAGDGVAYSDGHLYVADGDGGMQVIAWSPGDVPRLIGNLPLDDTAMDVAVLGDYAYLITEPAGITVAFKECSGATAVLDQTSISRSRLYQNEPNPFNPRTTIAYELAAPATVNLEVFDLSGRRIATLRDGVSETSGRHAVAWTGRDDQGRAVPSGMYFYRLRAGDHRETRKMALIR